jgi:FixJ family two-component response regulator
MHMPGLSGLELPRLLTEVNHPIPIIFVTAHEDESRAKALGQGAAAILSKPFSREELLAAIQSALECSER